MKKLLLLALCIASFVTASYSQQVVCSTTEPVGLYAELNVAFKSGDIKLAVQKFESVISFYENGGQLQQLPEHYFGMALMLALNGNYRESIRYHKKAIRSHKRIFKSEAGEMRINLGLTYELAGKERKAKRILG
jgi:tetratricopeptide (TPR) repeat protein